MLIKNFVITMHIKLYPLLLFYYTSFYVIDYPLLIVMQIIIKFPICKKFIKAKSENQSSGDANSSTPDVRKSDANKNNILNYENKKKSYANFEQRDFSGYDWDSFYANKD